MNSLVRDKGYKKLLADIAVLYSNARSVLVQTYWEIGKRIVKQEQSGTDKPEYGSHLIEQLSADLSEKFGEGFSVRNMYNFRQFFLTHRILQTSAELGWSQYVALMSVKDDKYDRYLADVFFLAGARSPERILKEGLFLNQDLLDKGMAKPF
jgi:hypothetical protein